MELRISRRTLRRVTRGLIVLGAVLAVTVGLYAIGLRLTPRMERRRRVLDDLRRMQGRADLKSSQCKRNLIGILTQNIGVTLGLGLLPDGHLRALADKADYTVIGGLIDESGAESVWLAACEIAGRAFEGDPIAYLRATLRNTPSGPPALRGRAGYGQRERDFTADPDVQSHAQWGRVIDPIEAAPIGAAVNTPLINLTPDQLQALAVQRSKDVDLADWVAALKTALNLMPRGDQNRSSLEGAVVRMERLTQGVIGRRYAKGPGSIAIEDLGLLGPVNDQWGVAVLEGGAELDQFSKSVLLGLIAWQLYTDAVARRRESIGRKLPALNIFFEEANKIR